jgi:hypothetical protein
VRAILDVAPFCAAAPDACAGDCATLPLVFADVPLPPAYPDGLQDYTCTAFPDDSVPSDTVVVALISIAIALPVGIFIGSAFELANDSEAPESWLAWSGLPRLLLGAAAHRRWHWTGPAGRPSRLVRWYCRCADAPKVEMLLNLWLSFKAWATCSQTPWEDEAAEAADQEVDRKAAGGSGDEHDECAPPAPSQQASSGASSTRELLAKKRAYTAIGLGAVALCWAIFSWCAAAARASWWHGFCLASHARARGGAHALLPFSLPTGLSLHMASSSIACWARRRRRPSHAAGACHMALMRRLSGAKWRRKR